ncbi:phosphate signaling complex protein PhoU [Luteolibacter yonseiensis]|uniref:Phosphate-specific transport system accessory protein PhoU n=1 Tax=Luteolibacter yonseiensis TaxID=1144680 RepID=A0A934QX45_9BACT|nr:phosphate signaling complex protein PhoU [Luteolibacter yonseiensis]MBK1814338.1 phosphate signaling complex protein PhoU [Luteolibacter yonseiensis]
MNTPHIFRDFDKVMEALKADVLLMASLARQNLERAMRSLLERDIDLARTVIADDSDVDDLERKIDQTGMEILVRFHPVASDLRLVITSMKMAHNLERISDHAVNIAKRSKKICKANPLEEASLTEPLYSLADKLLRDALMAYTDANTVLGEGLKLRDKELDRLHKQMISSLSGRLEDSNGRSENLLHLIFVARSIERIGDLAVNIGEDAVFLGEARDIRHEHRKLPEQ